tara:strand:+ start:706 stop:1209 length:504 start_codon:yes stop_codon:yes gene_type:complete
VESNLKFNISDFPIKPEKDFLNIIYDLNQSNTPEVGSLDSVKHLKSLLSLSSNNLFISLDNEIIGFVVCFREGSNYQSLNYKFFSKNETKFLYIDRVVIKELHRRKGIGKSLYRNIESISISKNIPLCCEVNIEPLNQPSIDFHNNFGFHKIGSYDFNDHSVAYFKK